MTGAGAWVALIGAVVAGLTGIAAFIKTIWEKPRLRAETMSIVNQRALATMDQVAKTAAVAQARLDVVEVENSRHEDRISELEERDDQHVRAMRILVTYIAEMHVIFEKANLVPPPNPLSSDELDQLLARLRRTNTNAEGPRS
jgi:hypothetical protein